MLLASHQKSTQKKVAILTRNPVATQILAGLLAEWGFLAVTEPADAEAVFIERGLSRPEFPGRLVWLSPMPLTDQSYLEIPLSITRLYHWLEEDLFPSPRRHIRIFLACPADLKVDERWLAVQMVSLSDRGGRLSCDREVAKGTPVLLEMKLAGRVVRLAGKVLYCIPAGDASGRETPQIGVGFEQIDSNLCLGIRRFIEWTCVERVCEKLQIESNDPALSWFEFARNPWAELA